MEGEEENKKEDVASLLHNKSKLQSLRTYQGDVADIIKSQNESVASITIKEKIRDEQEAPKVEKPNVGVSFVTLLMTLLLIGGSAVAILFVWRVLVNEQSPQIQIETEIISANNTVAISLITKSGLASELQKASLQMGVVLLKLHDTKGEPIDSATTFFDLLGIELPSLLLRNLRGEFALGTHSSQNQIPAYFLILRADDFGVAFSGLLEWEGNMSNDLSFLGTRVQDANTSTKSFVWKDVIIKNKDARTLVSTANGSDILLAYSFLDKNTILITNSLHAISEIASIYASRSVAR